MAALVQTLPQQTTTVTMLQTRPTNAGMMPAGQSQLNGQFVAVNSQNARSPYQAPVSPTAYRGSTAPVQPYAFTSTPNLNQAVQAVPWQQQYAVQRTNSSPAVPIAQGFDQNMVYRGRGSPNAVPMNHGHFHSMGVGQGGSRDDSSIVTPRNIVPAPRPNSAAYLSVSSQPVPPTGASSKNAPERYRRPSGQSSQHSRSQTLPTNIAVNTQLQANTNPALANRPNSFYAAAPGKSLDDSRLNRQSSLEDVKRARGRNVHTTDATDSKLASYDRVRSEDASRLDVTPTGKSSDKDAKGLRVVPLHSRNASSESVSSSRSSHSRPSSATNRNASFSTANPSLSASDQMSAKQDQAKLVNIPSRASSSDAAKRVLHPSPLSKPATMPTDASDNSPPSPVRPSTSRNLESPAAKQLAAINQIGNKNKSKTSRLRRAFSFGSAAEFRKASEPEGAVAAVDKAEPSRLHKDPTADEAYDAEQARIAEAQEAAGLGHQIYGSRFFGSTDNLSISSTASSASIMLRKMGRGMKKSTRSLVGLFRPKSVIGVPAAEPLVPEASQATVTMVTVEAESRRVNVSADPQKGTGFPHLERNSMDAAQVPDMLPERLGSSGTDSSGPRKSIVGGDKERAEVLAAVRKGILKRTPSPSTRVTDGSPDLVLPEIPAIADSPLSSAPSTPNDEAQGHRRTGSIAIGSEDYFVSALRLRQDNKSSPSTPNGGGKRNATFSPRIIFYDTWPSQEYDRRGEIATCNRLTPMLAQQIKEELNNFKMEMEVHENSKIYTHFF
ncbi:hypothetical protein B0I35DRAFT_21108 [Stachybotrys elegans]|uniref:Protein BNI4 n=1 Tax=Stachybotrys elegans TaxID=80388 RepID=A0A8K0T489_9HYPO|nr:hypothetical protein B0I35DRAFT_21108 [Stachybotrys elegans]